MKELFVEKNFRASSLATIEQANSIISEYMSAGYDLTLRQLYYQFVARDLIPNTQRSYKNLGNLINDARLAGLVDWSAIKDRTRTLGRNSHWDTPADIIASAASSFRIDTRMGQDTYVEVWVEKEALAGVIERTCRDLDIPWFACRGYISQTAAYEASKRAQAYNHKEVKIIHLGDHDPSGIDMTRDNHDRLEILEAYVDVERIALNMDQVEQYNCPPNPAKITDSRAGAYIDTHGTSSWELDALEPQVIDRLIRDAVGRVTDDEKRDRYRDLQANHIILLEQASDRWVDIVNFLGE